MSKYGIGQPVLRFEDPRLLRGQGRYINDVNLPGQAHAIFVRSPHAHARIKSIDAAAARKSPGVIAVVTGAELSKVITPWIGVLTHLKGLKSAPQHAIAELVGLRRSAAKTQGPKRRRFISP